MLASAHGNICIQILRNGIQLVRIVLPGHEIHDLTE